MKFKLLGINQLILRVIKEDGFEEPSEIQEKTIPLVLQGKDVIGGSATGSGKTLVFAAGIIEHVEKGKGIQALILVPTRELAEQVFRAIRHFSRYKPLNIVSVYGGLSINPQIDKLRDADIVIGTPGRILDHLSRDTLKTDNVKILVLDEADRMLDMGFIDDVEKIIRNCPVKRQTLLFSATIDADICYLAKKYLKNPVEVEAESYVDPEKLTQVYYDVPDNLKFSLLVHLLRNEKSDLVMVFCNTRTNTDFVAKNLRENKINALAVHGGFSQEKRNRTMKDFREENIQVLVCTDVAARGLDIKSVSHIYNYDTPKDAKEYIHRIGRTARAGEKGKAISILTSRDYENFRKILRKYENITQEQLPHLERVWVKWFGREERSPGGRRGYQPRHEQRSQHYGSRNRRR